MGSSCSYASSKNLEENLRRSSTNNQKGGLVDEKTMRYGNFRLTVDQMKIVEETWNFVVDKKKFNENVFLKIFEIDPKLKFLFGYEDLKTNQQLLSEPKFQMHASNFGAFLNMIIGNMKFYENVAVKACKVIGSKHVEFTKNLPFDPKMWQTFVAALLVEIEKELKTSYFSNQNRKIITNVLYAWADLFAKVTQVMEDAYNDEKSKDNDNAL